MSIPDRYPFPKRLKILCQVEIESTDIAVGTVFLEIWNLLPCLLGAPSISWIAYPTQSNVTISPRGVLKSFFDRVSGGGWYPHI